MDTHDVLARSQTIEYEFSVGSGVGSLRGALITLDSDWQIGPRFAVEIDNRSSDFSVLGGGFRCGKSDQSENQESGERVCLA
jgi:hypothetical protein